MDSFISLAKQGYEAYSKSQSDVSNTGGQQYNSPQNDQQYNSPQNDQQYNSPQHGLQINDDEVVQNAQKHGSDSDSSLFSSALGHVNQNQGEHNQPIDEDDVQDAHRQAYHGGSPSDLSASSLGSAAALQTLKKFTSGGGGSQSELISMAMAEATKLFDKSGGAASGNKQDAVNGAAMTVVKLLVQSKFSGGTTGGSNSGGLSSLMSLASKFT